MCSLCEFFPILMLLSLCFFLLWNKNKTKTKFTLNAEKKIWKKTRKSNEEIDKWTYQVILMRFCCGGIYLLVLFFALVFFPLCSSVKHYKVHNHTRAHTHSTHKRKLQLISKKRTLARTHLQIFIYYIYKKVFFARGNMKRTN